jgi:succinate dehydrogenase / fumarate reductase membrane anchor subunit
MADHPDSLRTPLGQVRYLGSAKFGSQENWFLHVTSVALVPLTIGFVWLLLALLPKDYNGVRAELARPLPAIVLLLFILAGIAHMHIGMRSVILDYVHGQARLWTLIANTAFATALAMACVFAAARIAFT